MSADRGYHWLEQQQVAELARQLASEGYEVVENVALPGGERLSLAAYRTGRKLAYEVRARPDLAESAHQLGRLRLLAREAGFDRFILKVVNPPTERRISVAGLEERLFEWLLAHPPLTVLALADEAEPERIEDVQILDLAVTPGGIRAEGSAFVKMIPPGGTPAREREQFEHFWLRFDVSLTPELQLETVHKFEMETVETVPQADAA